MHKKADTFEAEFAGVTGSPADLQPKPDLDVITDLVKQMPTALRLTEPPAPAPKRSLFSFFSFGRKEK